MVQLSEQFVLLVPWQAVKPLKSCGCIKATIAHVDESSSEIQQLRP